MKDGCGRWWGWYRVKWAIVKPVAKQRANEKYGTRKSGAEGSAYVGVIGVEGTYRVVGRILCYTVEGVASYLLTE